MISRSNRFLGFCISGVVLSYIYETLVGMPLLNNAINNHGHAMVDWTDGDIKALGRIHFVHIVLPILLELAFIVAGLFAFLLRFGRSILSLCGIMIPMAWVFSRWHAMMHDLFVLMA